MSTTTSIKRVVAEAVAREIADHRQACERQAARINEALAKLDEAIAIAEAGNEARGRQPPH